MLINQLSEVAPAGVLMAAVTWGALSYVITGPELANRIANADYRQACEASLSANFSNNFSGAISETQQTTQLERQAEEARRYVNSLRSQYGAQWDAFDRLSGGALSRAANQAEEAGRRAREARNRARQEIERRREAAIDSAPDQCACQATAALNGSRTDWAFYAGTFGIIEQDGVSGFPALMRNNARMCAERVQL